MKCFWGICDSFDVRGRKRERVWSNGGRLKAVWSLVVVSLSQLVHRSFITHGLFSHFATCKAFSSCRIPFFLCSFFLQRRRHFFFLGWAFKSSLWETWIDILSSSSSLLLFGCFCLFICHPMLYKYKFCLRTVYLIIMADLVSSTEPRSLSIVFFFFFVFIFFIFSQAQRGSLCLL